MELKISREELQKLVESTEKPENRKFAEDSWLIAVVRVVFVRWMRAHRLWGGYVLHLSKNSDMKNDAWEHPACAEDFLGYSNYEFSKAYVPWCEYLRSGFEKTIYELINGYTKDSQVC
jgi:hypothetical protein